MEQYINKSAVVAEIEKLISNGKLKCQQSQENNDQISYVAWSEHIATCGKILSFLGTLETKEVNLEKEANEAWDYIFSRGWDENSRMVLKHDEYMAFAKHFFELGLQTQKGE